MDDETADRVIKGVDELARNGLQYAELYQVEETTANFTYHDNNVDELPVAI